MIAPVLQDIWSLIPLFPLCLVQWIKREGNDVADLLAKFCLKYKVDFSEVDEIPGNILLAKGVA